MERWSVATRSPDQTRALGALLGAHVEAGTVILLNGDLGAGKTCFTQGVAVGLEVGDAPVTSPSYTLMNVYQGRLPLNHFDLYRLSHIEDLEDLGYDEIAEGGGLTVVEWADRISALPEASLVVGVAHAGEDVRRFDFIARDEPGRNLLQQVAAAWPAEAGKPA